MIPKPVTLSPPWNDQKIVNLERLLVTSFSNGIQRRMGSYTGDGVDNSVLFIGMTLDLIYIQRKEVGSGNAVFAIREAPDVSFIPGGGFVSTAVKSFTKDGVTLGTSTDVNAETVDYVYFAIG